jgi:hypothetical protein
LFFCLDSWLSAFTCAAHTKKHHMINVDSTRSILIFMLDTLWQKHIGLRCNCNVFAT